MLILAVNCGSSSLKAQVIDATRDAERRRARARVERIGGEAVVTVEAEGQAPERTTRAIGDHHAALACVLAAFRALGLPPAEAVGHRVVHGGARFVAPTRIDDRVIAELAALEELAPLHNAPGVAGIRACRAQLGTAIPTVAVFDTAFHATLPEVAYRYAIPLDLAERPA